VTEHLITPLGYRLELTGLWADPSKAWTVGAADDNQALERAQKFIDGEPSRPNTWKLTGPDGRIIVEASGTHSWFQRRRR